MLSPVGFHGTKSVIRGHCHLLAVYIHAQEMFVGFCCVVFPRVGEGGNWGSENFEDVLRVTPLQDGKARSHWRSSGHFGVFCRDTSMSGIEEVVWNTGSSIG